MRNGLQDYECLWLLENKISEMRITLAARAAALIDPRQRGVEIAAQVITDYHDHTAPKSPAPSAGLSSIRRPTTTATQSSAILSSTSNTAQEKANAAGQRKAGPISFWTTCSPQEKPSR
jgi:hypothetical protein